MTSEKSYLNDNIDFGLLKLSFLNNNGKIEWTKYLYLNDIGDFGFPLLALLALCPMSFKKGPNKLMKSQAKPLKKLNLQVKF